MSETSRLVRIFISSTFRDFMGERDELVKKVFPELRRRCKSRFVELLEVDLRWGITEAQSKQGDTLRICLKEIDQCRPSAPVFFIGMLGERYGWIPQPDFYQPNVLEDPDLSWVKAHVGGKSVTELEILHGVLNNRRMGDKAFFYFREPGYEQRHWETIANNYPDLRPEDFTNALEPDPQAAAAKQEALKAAIRTAGLKTAPQEYACPEALAARVLEDIWGQVDRIFPADEVPDALERERMDHEVFCRSRTRAYVERDGLFDRLDLHAEGEGPAARVVVGASGSGKSALLAAWLERQRERVVFYHFVGATPQSTDAEGLLRRLHGSFRRRGVLPAADRFPEGQTAIAAAVPQWLEQLAAQGGGVILLDALNQLQDSYDRELWWWPESWPDAVRVVFSCLPGDVRRVMDRRGWTQGARLIEVPPLREGERQTILERYLKLFSRSLEPRLQTKILAAPQCANPLFLRSLLDELRLRARHEELEAHIDRMLGCRDTAALFVLILMQLEADFSPREYPHLVHEGLGLLGMARRGLTERELLELLSPGERPAADCIPRHYWSPLYLALEDSLVSREGQLSFFHDYLRQAVWLEYLDEPAEQQIAHERLAAPALRWQDAGAYGATTSDYGFRYGIGHLLALGRQTECAELLLNRRFTETCVRAHKQPALVSADLAAVRRACATADTTGPQSAAALCAEALTAPTRLSRCLHETLDAAAAEGDWDEVITLAAADEGASGPLLLASRALAGADAPQADAGAGKLQSLMARWAAEAASPAWDEVIERLGASRVARDHAC